jgi:hypothetical protein
MKPFVKKIDPELQALKAKANVHRIGKGIKFRKGRSTGEVAWIISVSQKLPIAELAAGELIPPTFKGLPTDVVIRKRAELRYRSKPNEAPGKLRTDRWRPAPGGVSIGHYLITAGTLAVVVYQNGQPYILSNNHVLANCNDADIGNAILQPGAYDGGGSLDRIGTLIDFVPIVYANGDNGDEPPSCPIADTYVRLGNFLARLLGSSRRVYTKHETLANLVDCAIAKPDRDNDVSDEILEIGKIYGVTEPKLGMSVRKSGRTTGLTQEIIRETEVTVDVNMGDGRIAVFTDCFATDDMCDPGDSGSLTVNGNRAVGLLFAGSDRDTIHCKYSNVKEALGLD